MALDRVTVVAPDVLSSSNTNATLIQSMNISTKSDSIEGGVTTNDHDVQEWEEQAADTDIDKLINDVLDLEQEITEGDSVILDLLSDITNESSMELTNEHSMHSYETSTQCEAPQHISMPLEPNEPMDRSPTVLLACKSEVMDDISNAVEYGDVYDDYDMMDVEELIAEIMEKDGMEIDYELLELPCNMVCNDKMGTNGMGSVNQDHNSSSVLTTIVIDSYDAIHDGWSKKEIADKVQCYTALGNM